MAESANTTQDPLFDTSGGRINQRRLRHGLRVSTAASALGTVWVAVAFGVPTTMFMEALGASGVLIGAVVTVQQLAMIVQIPAALLAERMKSRKLFWGILAALHRMIWIFPAFLPMLFRNHMAWAAPAMLGIIAFSGICGHAVTASWMSWIADLVPDGSKARFWGRRQAVTMVAFLLGTGLTGWILDCFPAPGSEGGSFNGFAITFVIGALFGMADIFVHSLVPEPMPVRKHGRAALGKRLLAPLKDADFRWLTLSMGTWAFSVGIIGSFGMVYLKRNFAVGYGALTAIPIAAGVGTAVAGPVWGRLMGRIGSRAFGGIMMAVSPLMGVVWFLLNDSQILLPWIGGAVPVPQPVFMIVFSSLVAGAFYSGVNLCQLNLAGMMAPRQGRTMAMAVHWTLFGTMGAVGPLFGGRIMDAFVEHPVAWALPGGQPFSYIHVMVLLHLLTVWLIALPVFVKIRKCSDTELSLRGLVGNPLRAMGMVQNMMAFDAGSPKTRVRATRSLGKKRTPEAARSLIPQLDDALPEIREAAVDALGEIGTPEAVDALLHKLEDPETDLEDAIIKALRNTHNPQVVEPLLERLRQGEKTVRIESAKTLGNAGQRDVAPELLHLLENEKDPQLAFAFAEGLVRLKAYEAVPQLVRFFREARSMAGSRRRALLIAELIGDARRFYELLTEEDNAGGEGLVSALKQVLKTTRKSQKSSAGIRRCLDRLEAALDDGQFADALLAGVDVWEELAVLRPVPDGPLPAPEEARKQFFAACSAGWKPGESRPCGEIELLLLLHVLVLRPGSKGM